MLTILGIAMAGAIMLLGDFQGDSIDYILHVQYDLAQRQNLSVSFTEPTSQRAEYELARLPGVQYTEPFRHVPIGFRFKQLLLHVHE